jgi:flavodoxin
MKKNVRRLLHVLLVLALIISGWTALSFFTVAVKRPLREFTAPTSRFDFGNVLVVYYSLGGNTAEVAGRIKEMTDGTLLEIETENTYPSAPALYIAAGLELKNSNLPILKNTVPDFSSYDVIFVGSPAWWFTISTPVLSFLSKADFKGKAVVPFSTDGGNYGNFFVHFTKEAHNANVMEGMNFSNVSKTDTTILDQKISTWLEKLKGKEIW